jgi:hypothetical protein
MESMAAKSGFKTGDRVRICAADSEYTGCRGTVADDPASLELGVTPLGHFVAIDGENGVVRPFLLSDLQPLQPAIVRRRAEAARSGQAAVNRNGR